MLYLRTFPSDKRKKNMTGFDLSGNTYWEFRIAGSGATDRWRRIVKYPRSTHYSDIRISPQWHQWLRYTRPDPPSVHEQRVDQSRQAQMKQLAAQADARWEAKPRLTDAPASTGKPGEPGQQPLPALASARSAAPAGAGAGKDAEGSWVEGKPAGSAARETSEAAAADSKTQTQQQQQTRRKGEQKKEDPWAQAKSRGPGETWQPQAWTPPSGKTR